MPYKPQGKRAPVVCHWCKRKAISATGGDIACSPTCKKAAADAKAAAIEKLTAAGFQKHPRILNLFSRDGAHVSVESVIREGISNVIALHKTVTTHA